MVEVSLIAHLLWISKKVGIFTKKNQLHAQGAKSELVTCSKIQRIILFKRSNWCGRVSNKTVSKVNEEFP